jgi:hypothetical protein
MDDRPAPAPPQFPSPLHAQHQAPGTLPLPLIADLNRKFALGAPSNSLSEAGVVMRVLDGFERSDAPWAFDPSSPTGDRASASIVNARHPDIYENLLRPIGWQRMPGLVLADAPTQERLSCAYWRDGGTDIQTCSHSDPECRPGCTNWCKGDMDWYCAFPPWRLQEMMEAHDRKLSGHRRHWAYNEVSARVCRWGKKGEGRRRVHRGELAI